MDGGVVIGKRAKRVRLHTFNAEPSLEGFLVSRRRGEYELAVPQMLTAADRPPDPLDDARTVLVPKANVWFVEVLG